MSQFRGAVQTLLGSTSVTTNGVGAVLNLNALGGGSADGGQFLLNVSSIQTSTTLDVYLQHSTDAGTTWWDFGHFTQVTTSQGKQSLTWARKSQATDAASTGVVATGDAVLAAATVINGPIVDNYVRVKYAAVTSGQYTFSVLAVLDRD